MIECLTTLPCCWKSKFYSSSRDNYKASTSFTLRYQKKVVKYSIDLTTRDWSYVYYPAPLFSLLKQPKLNTSNAGLFIFCWFSQVSLWHWVCPQKHLLFFRVQWLGFDEVSPWEMYIETLIPFFKWSMVYKSIQTCLKPL